MTIVCHTGKAGRCHQAGQRITTDLRCAQLLGRVKGRREPCQRSFGVGQVALSMPFQAVTTFSTVSRALACGSRQGRAETALEIES